VRATKQQREWVRSYVEQEAHEQVVLGLSYFPLKNARGGP
jgi:hypothetical protein